SLPARAVRYEIEHDGFRIIGCKDDERGRLSSGPGNALTPRFPLIVETLAGLRARSCIIDGEVVACDDNGVASFELIRHDRVAGGAASPFQRPRNLQLPPLSNR